MDSLTYRCSFKPHSVHDSHVPNCDLPPLVIVCHLSLIIDCFNRLTDHTISIMSVFLQATYCHKTPMNAVGIMVTDFAKSPSDLQHYYGFQYNENKSHCTRFNYGMYSKYV